MLILDMGAQPRRISDWRRPLHITKICHSGHRKNHIKVLDRLGKARPVRDFARGARSCPLDLEFGAALATVALPFTPRCCAPAAP